MAAPMKFVFAALFALTTQAHAAVSDGMWFSPDKSIQISFDGLAFTRMDPATGAFVQCKIVDWPISSPTAQGSCENGERHALEIGVDYVVFDGVELQQTLEALD